MSENSENKKSELDLAVDCLYVVRCAIDRVLNEINRPWYDKVSIMVMRDNHTFYEPTGKTLDDIIADILRFWEYEDSYCMVCPVRFIKGNNYTGPQVGKAVHGSGKEDKSIFYRELIHWKNAVLANPDIMEWLMCKYVLRE